jgi:HSP20 family protein
MKRGKNKKTATEKSITSKKERRQAMALIRWNPLRDYDLLRREMDRLFDEFPKRYDKDERSLSTHAWTPSVDIYEDPNEVLISVELPGVEEKEIKLDVEDGTLTISGERKLEKEDRKDGYHRVERYYGSFSRGFTLPPYVDQEKIAARLDKGVLKVSLPKKEETRPKKIEIKVGK